MQRKVDRIVREKRTVSHPRDRKVRQLERKEKREVRLAEQKERLKSEQTQRLVRYFWFREQCIALGYVDRAVPEEEILLLAQLYIDRNRDEIAQLKQERNPPTGRIRQLEAARVGEMDAFRSAKGLDVPSLADADDVEILTQIWDGLAETVVVVPSASVSLGTRALSPQKLAAVSARLRPIEEVRTRATPLLPRRAVKMAQQARPARRVSVKYQDQSLAAVKARGVRSLGQKQQRRLKQGRKTALDSRRSD